MPCKDPEPDGQDDGWNSVVLQLEARVNLTEAMLCALTGFLLASQGEHALVKLAEWKGWTIAGVKPEIYLTWWHDHQQRDEQRRENEAKIRRENIERHNALAKLSLRERRLLGLPGR